MSEKTHPQVEYHVDGGQSDAPFITGYADRAMVVALDYAIARGTAVLDVCIFTEAGARAFGGDDAVERYREDPDASVFERYEITVNNAGRVA